MPFLSSSILEWSVFSRFFLTPFLGPCVYSFVNKESEWFFTSIYRHIHLCVFLKTFWQYYVLFQDFRTSLSTYMKTPFFKSCLKFMAHSRGKWYTSTITYSNKLTQYVLSYLLNTLFFLIKSILCSFHSLCIYCTRLIHTYV